ncbi:MAG: thiamine pyrophosphate-binding protein, partial [Opitutales bacterium]|nr:thiamine pyrophosphate-binding protein [Opitutales bacterium]
LGCIVAGDIGCYTLAAMKPISGMDMQICMGASIGMGLGMRKVLPEDQARKVVSVIGDSTFMHSGLTGLAQAVYNPPKTGHVIIVVDNAITAMTGHQENPATGRKLDHSETKRISIEAVARAMGADNVEVFNPVKEQEKFKAYLAEKLAENGITLIVLRQPCIFVAAAEAKRKAAK